MPVPGGRPPAEPGAGPYDRIEQPLESPRTLRDISSAGRGRGLRTVTAAEKAQARDVSLRRIGRLFTPYRWPLAVVTAIIVASSIVGLASPFLLRAVIDTALPARNVQLLAWLVAGMVAVAAVTSAFGDPTRREIYLHVRSNPGATASEVATAFSLHPNVARHHLDRLSAGGYLEVSLERSAGAGA